MRLSVDEIDFLISVIEIRLAAKASQEVQQGDTLVRCLEHLRELRLSSRYPSRFTREAFGSAGHEILRQAA